MQAVFAVTVPFFALVLLGWLAARWRMLPESAIPGLNIYVLFFALPCLLFRFGSSLPLARLADPALLGIYLVSALVVVGASVALTWRGRGDGDGVDLRDAAFGALVAAFPNAGFMGVPLLVALFGDAAAGPVIGAIVVDLVVTSTLCLALAQADTGRSAGANERSAARGALVALRGALTNPLPWAIVIGACFALAHRELPGPIAQIVRMLGDSATPVALFTIGSVLWRAGQHAHTRTPVGRYLPLALIKLVAHPVLVFAIGLAARALGAPVSASGLMVLTLTAALPSASNASLLAERYGADNGRIARIILASTVLAFATFSACAWLFGVGTGPWSSVRRNGILYTESSPSPTMPAHLVKLQSAPDLVDQVYRALLDAISDGSIAPGARLTQETIAADLAVSRQPVLQALRLLKKDGLVLDAPGRGVLVAPLEPSWIAQVYEVRGALDALAARLAAARRAVLDPKLVERGRRAARGRDIQAMIEADIAFHQAVYAASGNPLIAKSAETHWVHLRRVMGAVLQQSPQREALWDEHEAIARAIAKGDAERAAHLIDHHGRRASANLQTRLADVLTRPSLPVQKGHA